MGTRFWGARGSLCGADARLGSTWAVTSARATASAGGRSAEHSSRTTADQGARVAPDGSFKYQDRRSQDVPILNTGLRWPGPSEPTTSACAACRYDFWWVFT